MMTTRLIALAALALLAATNAAPAAVFECSSARETTRDAIGAIALKAASAKDKAQRCSAGGELLPLAERQIAIAQICEAGNHVALNAAQQNASQARANYRSECGG
jgi:hypothetical protein